MLSLDFSQFPELSTERTLLKQMQISDAKAFYTMRSSPEMMKYISRPLHQSVEETEQFIQKIIDSIQQNEYINWGIFLKTNPEVLIGSIGFYRIKLEHYRGEVGYMLHHDYWKQGIMYEVLKTVVQYGFEKIKFHSIEADINPKNMASRALLLKAGFVKEAYFKENMFSNGVFEDSEIFSMLTPYK
ncbi:MAG: GNAT family N-acetyltransferase [Chitinophagaceae bacterium]